MAEAIVTFRDDGDDVNVRVDFNPPLLDKDSEPSSAQRMAVALLLQVREFFQNDYELIPEDK